MGLDTEYDWPYLNQRFEYLEEKLNRQIELLEQLVELMKPLAQPTYIVERGSDVTLAQLGQPSEACELLKKALKEEEE